MEGLHNPRSELSKVRVQLDNIEVELVNAGDNIPYKTSLRNDRVALLARLDKLENVIQAMTPTTPTTPAPPPPRNSITLPQVLPLASFLLLPLFLQNSLFVNQLQLN